MEFPETRRSFIHGAAAGGAAALTFKYLGGQASAGAPASLLDGAGTEVEVLARLLDIEQLVVFSYRHVLGSVRLSSSVRSTLRRFLGQEIVHARTLAGELSRGGHRAPVPPTSVRAVDGGLAALGMHKALEDVHTEFQALLLLQSVEGVEQHAFHEAVTKLSSGTVGQLAAQMLTCDAQQWTVLTERLRHGNVQRAVPYAFAPLAAELKA
jgi:hypothetical protein